MSQRAAYYKVAPEGLAALRGVSAYLEGTAIDKRLRALLELRVSQINGCVYCCDKHCQEAREAGETQQRLDCLAAWRECPFFDAKEKAALAWAESLTYLPETGAPDAVYNEVSNHFSERDLVDLTFIITMMNQWNRIAVGFRTVPARRSE